MYPTRGCVLVAAVLLIVAGCRARSEVTAPETVNVAVALPAANAAPSMTLDPGPTVPIATQPPTSGASRTLPPTGTSVPPTVAPPTVAPPPVALEPAPLSLDGLAIWLAQAWQDRRDPAEVRTALLAAGWQADQSEWRNLELTGDLSDEWVLQLHDLSATMSEAYLPTPAMPGNVWIVGAAGVLYAHHAGIDALGREPGLMPEVAAIGDMTGDGLLELVLQDTDCGAHTCYGYISVIGDAGEGLSNLVDAGDPYQGLITISYPDVRLVPEDSGDVLYVHGGLIGSVGAGIMRAYTETWAWNGESVSRRDTAWDISEYRHHLLYEAMDLMDAGRLADAQALLIRVLEDPDLVVEPFGDASLGETEAAISQFAGFRLVLTLLLRGDRMEAGRRASWLVNAYPGAPLAMAAGHAVDGWSGRVGLRALCARLQADLETYDAPTGPLESMGYGNPSITTTQLCMWGE